jgi:anthranilate 1,2-dioxygenase small subunit
MNNNSMEIQFQIQNLNARYASTIDNDRLEEWPDYFTEDCLYRITTKEDFDEGLPLGIIYATSRNMLIDRVTSLRDANIYEAQCYRHIISTPLILSVENNILEVETNFAVLRIMHDGDSMLFASGRYLDRIEQKSDDLKFAERIVVADSRKFDTLLAIPL